MPHLGAAFAAAGPVVAGVVRVVREIGRSVGHGAGEDIVFVRLIASRVDAVAVLIESGAREHVGADMELVQVLGNQVTVGVVPGALADTAAGIGAATAFPLRAQVGAPGPVARAGGLRQRLTVGVRAFNTTEVATVTQPDTGDEERHVLRKRSLGTHKRQRCNRQGVDCSSHLPRLPCCQTILAEV